MEMENATRTTLTSFAGQAVHALNNTASQFLVLYDKSLKLAAILIQP
jgi:hypothetical protein